MGDSLWTVEDVARFLKVCPRTVYNLRIRYTKIGNCRRYDPEDVRAFVLLNSNRAPVLPRKRSHREAA